MVPKRTGRSWARGMACLALVTILLAPAGKTRAAYLSSIRFDGLRRISEARASKALSLQPGAPFSSYQVAKALRRLFRTGWFEQIEAFSAGDSLMDLVLRVRECPVIARIRFQGLRKFEEDEIRDSLAIDVGDPASGFRLFRARRRLTELYKEKGYPAAKIRSSVERDTAGLATVLFLVDEGPRLKVAGVDFVGNQLIPDDELRDHVKHQKPKFLRKPAYDPDEALEDASLLQDFYASRGFLMASVRPAEPLYSADSSTVTVVFQIEEGKRFFVRDVRWEGATEVEPKTLQRLIRLRRGEPFDRSKLRESIAAAHEIYSERGYMTSFEVLPDYAVEGDSVSVVLRVREGERTYVGDVEIRGNTKTHENVIRRELDVIPGRVLRRADLLRSQRDVMSTGFFEDIDFELFPDEADSEATIVFHVKERQAMTATGGISYSGPYGLSGFVALENNNIFGRGQSVSIKLEFGGKRSIYDISFTDPWIWDRPITAGFDLYNMDVERRVSGTLGSGTYTRRDRGLGVRLGLNWPFRIPDYTRLSFGYSYTETRFRNFEGLSSKAEDLLVKGEGSRSRLEVVLTRNSLDNPFNPSLGVRTRLSWGFTGGVLGGSMDYYLATLDHRQYFSPWKKGPSFHVRLRAGYIDTYRAGGRMPPEERFRLGGCQGFEYMRGYDYYYVVPEENVSTDEYGRQVRFPGGKVMLGLTGEVRFRLVSVLGLVLFADAADTWNNGYGISLNDLPMSFGAGLTMEVPMLGRIEWYWAYAPRRHKWMPQFAFGGLM